MNARTLSLAAWWAASLFSPVTLGAQHAADHKPARTADPVKGYGEVTPLTEAERKLRRRPHAEGPVAPQVLAGQTSVFEANRVHYGLGADGRTWASGTTYKASFGTDGFTYVPFLGSRAPKNYPVQFIVAAVKVGQVDVAFARDVAPVRTGDRVVFDRGGVREIYDLSANGIEQTFVVDAVAQGDVVVELAIRSELTEDASRAGVQFGNGLGGVDYGTAYVVDGATKREISSSFTNDRLSLHVPANKRATGAVVIDPVISTSTVSFAVQDLNQPDLAFDKTNQRYLVVWERVFSAADSDVWCEMRDPNGVFVPGTTQVIDNSTEDWSKPRVANLYAYANFLVVAERYLSSNPVGQQYSIWGRTVGADAPFAMTNPREFSGTEVGDKRDPDVGGNAKVYLQSAPPPCWTVVYTRERSSTDHDIHARQVNGGATLRGGTILIENSANTIYRDVEISQSNSDLAPAEQRWLLVYSYKFSSTDWDVYGAALDVNGVVTRVSGSIDTTSASHVNPSVSSPTHDFVGPLMFGVTFEDATNVNDLRGTVVGANLQSLVPTTNLSNLLNAGTTFYPRIETDGCRFVVAYASGAPAFAATLGVVNNTFVVHEAPQQIGTGINAYHLNITSRGSAGDSNTGYGIVLADHAPDPDRIVFALYEGHGSGGFTTRPTGCNGLGIAASGRALLGRSVTVTLTGTANELVGMLLGVPGPALTLCSTCVVGVDLNGPLVNLPGSAGLNLSIPCMHQLVGRTLTVQGYAFGSGPCLNGLRLGASLDIIVQ